MAVTNWQNMWVSSGSGGWQDIGNVFDSDDAYCTYTWSGEIGWKDSSIVVASSSKTGDNKARVAVFTTTDTVYLYGGASDMWGSSITLDDIKTNTYLEMRMQFRSSSDELLALTVVVEKTEWAAAGNSLPSDGVLTGIEFGLEIKTVEETAGTETIYIDHTKIRLHYESGTPTVGVKYPLPAFRRP